MTIVNKNAVVTESVTILMLHVLIDRKEILPQVLKNEEVVKRVLMGWMYIEPKNVQVLNETTFLDTYASCIVVRRLGLLLKRLRIGWTSQWLLYVTR